MNLFALTKQRKLFVILFSFVDTTAFQLHHAFQANSQLLCNVNLKSYHRSKLTTGDAARNYHCPSALQTSKMNLQDDNNSNIDNGNRQVMSHHFSTGWDEQIRGSLQNDVKKKLVSLLFITATLLSPWSLEFDFPLYPQQQHVSILDSRAFALTEEQLLVDDVWREVTRQFVDPTFNGLGEEGWKKQRLNALQATSDVGPDDQEVVYSAIRKMLQPLGDPYTRFLTPEQYESLTAYARDGSTAAGSGGGGGIGVQLIGDPASGKVLVLNTIDGGPAAKAGIIPGDIILEVDDMDVDGATPEVVAAMVRGREGTDVSLTVRHGTNGRETPPGPNDGGGASKVLLKRKKINSNALETSTFVTDTGKNVGVIKIASFNQETTGDVLNALKILRDKSSSAIAIDLRGNVGGYMPAGVDVAKLFLPSKAKVTSQVDKNGKATIYFNDGIGSETNIPVFIIVDKRTASASEILTGALQDNNRATVVGETQTFGKGRIQNVQALEGGSGISITKAKYVTPKGKDIQGVGISPDAIPKSCKQTDSVATCLTGLL